MISFSKERFETMLRATEGAAGQSDIRLYEPQMAMLLDYIHENAAFRAEMSAILIDHLLAPSLSSFEVIEYCMHELRWIEVRDAARSRLSFRPDERVRYGLMRLLESFSDTWEGKAAYSRYSGE